MSPGGSLSALFAVSFLYSVLSVLDSSIFGVSLHLPISLIFPLLFLGTSRIEWLDTSGRDEAFREKNKLGSVPFSSLLSSLLILSSAKKLLRVVFQCLRQSMKDELWKMLSLAHHRPTISIHKSYGVFVPGVFNRCYQ